MLKCVMFRVFGLLLDKCVWTFDADEFHRMWLVKYV